MSKLIPSPGTPWVYFGISPLSDAGRGEYLTRVQIDEIIDALLAEDIKPLLPAPVAGSAEEAIRRRERNEGKFRSELRRIAGDQIADEPAEWLREVILCNWFFRSEGERVLLESLFEA